MRRSNRWGWYKAESRKPPPEHGIKIKKLGATWWGQRWIEALEVVLRGDSSRLARGRTYARAGRTHDLVVKGGKVAAQVTGSRPTPYKITIELGLLPDAAWKKAIAGMAAKAQFSADLLAGQMPKEIDEVFRAAGTSLFPQNRTELVTNCSCPDWGDPCKHVAATHYVLGEALDGDPFLLFELRGRTKERVLDAIRAVRGGGEASPAKKGRGSRAGKNTTGEEGTGVEVPTVNLGKIKAAEYDQPREALPSLHFAFDAPVAHGAVLRQLGLPAAWSGRDSPAEVLGPLVRAAAETARRLALSEPQDEPVEPALALERGRGRRRARNRPRA